MNRIKNLEHVSATGWTAPLAGFIVVLALAALAPGRAWAQEFPIEEYFPLEYQAKWLYLEDGRAYVTSYLGTERVHGKSSLEFGEDEDDYDGYVLDAAGLWMVHEEDSYFTTPIKVSDRKVKVGDQFESTHRVEGEDVTETMKWIGPEKIQVKAGEFTDCLGILQETSLAGEIVSTSVTWLAKGVGTVLEEGKDEDGELYRSELIWARVQSGEIPADNPTYPICEYFPLGKEDSWTYSDGSSTYLYSILGTEELKGIRAVRRGISTLDYDTLVCDAKGLWEYGESRRLHSAPVPISPANVKLGTWRDSTNFEVDAMVSNRYTFLGTEDVTVYAGTFKDCLKFQLVYTVGAERTLAEEAEDEEYDEDDDEDEDEEEEDEDEERYTFFWLARGVGIVKQQEVRGEEVETEELIRATVGGKSYGDK